MQTGARHAISRKGKVIAALLGLGLAVRALDGQAAPLAFELPFSARQTHSVTSIDSFALPTAPFADGNVTSLPLEGEVSRMAWQVGGQMTTLQLLAPLREKLEGMGFVPLLQCDTDACGGFDFRFAVDVIEAPDMNVDLFDFRALSARRGVGKDADYVFLLVSRAGPVGYIQLVHITPAPVALFPQDDPADATQDGIDGGSLVGAHADSPGDPADGVTADEVTITDPDAAAMAAALTQGGRVVLGDLIFATGSAELAEAPYDALTALAAFLKAGAGRRVALVGHTDTEGSLAGNIALSKRRARAVMERLSRRYGVPSGQMTAEGAGYLAPRATNLTEAGREANRRVEAVLLSLD
ncbi:OmpA family protein [Pseudooceanicola sediminis]|uniref:OmpA family protein n=1 Tax=Pseudooceanicola sediminis TaxID=2211117 RepID=A0A399IZ38_9RHOB|nr:OmpA family protein [Pseudooceanicola sediminis]KAA2312531.1 OmpA family protein [Puniceibacterium sp. HSS470]RII37539.1 OmpA family protein [Pseudooceanicola sediminis]|tara:strand:+ start:52176 stop:53237 length:1062 start_codon:yes stop_codon:yes gene_type:complete